MTGLALQDRVPAVVERPAPPAAAGATSDAELMCRYRDGDAAAFETLFRRHRDSLYRFLLRRCGERESALELFQDVWTRVIAAQAGYRAEARFATYLYQIAHRCFLDQVRRRRRRPTEPLAPELAEGLADPNARTGEEVAIGMQSAAALRAAIAALPDEQRAAFLLREEAGLSLAEIAKVTGSGAETAKSRLRYAVSKLKASLVAAGEWP